MSRKAPTRKQPRRRFELWNDKTRISKYGYVDRAIANMTKRFVNALSQTMPPTSRFMEVIDSTNGRLLASISARRANEHILYITKHLEEVSRAKTQKD